MSLGIIISSLIRYFFAFSEIGNRQGTSSQITNIQYFLLVIPVDFFSFSSLN